MKQLMILVAAVMLAVPVMADTFGTGANQFTIVFVPISANPGETRSINTRGETVQTFTNGTVGPWTDPGYNYRMGKFEITNAQWAKFVAEHGKPYGNPTHAYDEDPHWKGANLPTNNVSWYEAAQFVNWLNVQAGKTEAYKFTGEKGTSNYTLGVWNASDAWGGTNLYRHKDAFYFLPTEDEWVKAAYWNGTSLQKYATKAGESLYQGNGSNYGWNYYDNGYATDPYGPWAVGSGSQELNGTFDMMGNVYEWMESPDPTGNYLSGSDRGLRGGSYSGGSDFGVDFFLASSARYFHGNPYDEINGIGFRVASVPEPASLALLFIGGLALRYRKR